MALDFMNGVWIKISGNGSRLVLFEQRCFIQRRTLGPTFTTFHLQACDYESFLSTSNNYTLANTTWGVPRIRCTWASLVYTIVRSRRFQYTTIEVRFD